jgi:hypothetical protein
MKKARGRAPGLFYSLEADASSVAEQDAATFDVGLDLHGNHLLHVMFEPPRQSPIRTPPPLTLVFTFMSNHLPRAALDLDSWELVADENAAAFDAGLHFHGNHLLCTATTLGTPGS